MARQIETSDFERSHGRAPRGTGLWAFVFKFAGHEETRFVPHAMSLTDAKKWARANAPDWAVEIQVGS